MTGVGPQDGLYDQVVRLLTQAARQRRAAGTSEDFADFWPEPSRLPPQMSAGRSNLSPAGPGPGKRAWSVRWCTAHSATTPVPGSQSAPNGSW